MSVLYTGVFNLPNSDASLVVLLQTVSADGPVLVGRDPEPPAGPARHHFSCSGLLAILGHTKCIITK